jgi:hypothetical protein
MEVAMARWACDRGARRLLWKAARAASLVVLAACATSGVSRQGPRWESTQRRAKPEDAVIEVVERSAITRPYKPIWVVQATAPRWEKGPSDAKMLAALTKEARALGGDAITDLVRNPASKPEWWGPRPFYARQLREVRWAALVIVWQD